MLATQTNQTNLQVFNFNSTNLDYGIYNSEPVFHLNNVAEILGIKNPRMSMDMTDTDYVIKLNNSVVNFTYNRNLNNRGELFLTEAGLYRLIMRSNKPSAETFQKWVVKDVLPAIRRTGKYEINRENINKEEYNLKLEDIKKQKAKILLSLAKKYKDKADGRFSQVLDSYATKELLGFHALPLPELDEHYYTAEEVGKILGISANKVGRIANLNKLKTSTYGKYFIDKAKYTNKEIEAFRYNQAGIDYIKQLLV